MQLNNFKKIIAHELGHGYFQLKHPFEMGLTQNDLPTHLMDYGGGTEFNKYEWDLMHDPGIVTGLFESDSSGMMNSSFYAFIENPIIAFEDVYQTNPEQKHKAIYLLNNFAKNINTTTVWKYIKKEDFISSLTNMINNPNSINQKITNLCGIAVSCKAGIEYSTEMFVNMALSFYQTGEYLNYKANPNLYSTSNTNGLNAAEYVIMATLRHSLNMVLEYNPSNDMGASGFTYPDDVEKILTRIMKMKKVTSLDWGIQISTIKQLQDGIVKALSNNHFVILIVNIDHFSGKSSWSLMPDHYIQITGIKENIDGTLSIDWWSWGSQQQPVKISKNQFIKSVYYYGSFE